MKLFKSAYKKLAHHFEVFLIILLCFESSLHCDCNTNELQIYVRPKEKSHFVCDVEATSVGQNYNSDSVVIQLDTLDKNNMVLDAWVSSIVLCLCTCVKLQTKDKIL